jgi:Uma2 family endonuclease
MTLTTKRLTFAEYLTYSDGTDTRYELVNGELVAMSIGTGEHGEIIDFLYRQIDAEIARIGCDWIVRPVAIGVRSPRAGKWDTSRIPDLIVIPTQQWRKLRSREAVIELNEPSPILVIEVVSESTKTTDYRAKRVEYNVLNIPEYWVVDPLTSKVTIFTLIEELYEGAEFASAERIVSGTFPDLNLTSEQIIWAGEIPGNEEN